MRSICLSLFFITTSLTGYAAELKADFNTRCVEIQQHLYSLKLKDAAKLLELEVIQNPENITADYLYVIHDLLKVLVSESPESFEKFHKRSAKAIKRLDAYTQKDVFGNFYKQEIYFYSSVVQGKSGNAVSAANDIRLSYKYGQKVIGDYPEYLPAYKTLGLIHAGFGNLPTTYRKLVSMLGYAGSTDKGIEELQSFILAPSTKPEWKWMQKEASFYLAAIKLYLKNDRETAWTLIDRLTSADAPSPLLTFMRSNFADKCKKNDEVIRTLKNTPKDAAFEDIPHLDFLMGTAKLQRLDPDASVYLLRFLNRYKGSSYIKSCYQKLAWNSMINNDTKSYKSYMSKLKLNGNLNLEEDQQAQMEADRNETPDSRLLKARLLFDGGYYPEALIGIRMLKAEDFTSTNLKTEYCYRKARIYHQLNDFELAEAFYKAAILTGEKSTLYYASYSCLYLAEVYEKNGKSTDANTYFKKATTLKDNKEYKNSVEHRAKAGLQRLKQQ